MTGSRGDDKTPYLLTPGPLTTDAAVRAAMGRDWGSRDAAFIALTARICDGLLAVAADPGDGPGDRGAKAIPAIDEYVCVPLQGSGTFAIEATLATLVPPGGRALVLVNGAYGRRMVEILGRLGRAVDMLETAEDMAPDLDVLSRALDGDPGISHVAAVHCETTSGILNPIEAIAERVVAAGRSLIIDAMSSFGALPLPVARRPVAVVASANKCLEGVPGLSFAIIARDALMTSKGNAASLCFDLYDQHGGFVKNGQWRFTPPTQVVAALEKALELHRAEGGVAGRRRRYGENARVLIDGMTRLGFRPFLSPALQAPVIVTFHMPDPLGDPSMADYWDFQRFYDGMASRGFLIYPGKLTAVPSFRIGCIGAIGPAVMEQAVAAAAATLGEMGAPPPA